MARNGGDTIRVSFVPKNECSRVADGVRVL